MTPPDTDTGTGQVAIDITVEAGDWPEEADLRPLVEAAVATVMADAGFGDVPTELSVVLTDDAAMRAINGQWRGMDKPTNVLSFPAFPVAAGERPGPMLGDIVLARETIVREAGLDGKMVDAHFTHLIIHGLLHLLGHDHENDTEAELMERTEREALARLGIADPYADSADD